MNKLSVTLIIHNEEKNLERCLKSVSFADEIVIVDSHSTDNSISIAEKFGGKVITTDWLGFGPTKKLAVDNTSNEWVFSIDADEEVSPELKARIQEVLLNPDADGYEIKRKSYYIDRLIEHCGWDSDFTLRLFNKRSGNFNDKPVHEYVQLNGIKKRIFEPLIHYPYPNIESHIRKINKYSDLAAQRLIEQGKTYGIFRSLFFAVNKFMKMYFLKLGFLDGKEGLLLSLNSAFGVYLKYMKTWKRKK